MKQSQAEQAGEAGEIASSTSSEKIAEATANPGQGQPGEKAEPPIVIPPLLLEGDEPSASSPKPAEKYALGPSAAESQKTESGELPEAYGTQRVLLAARDPHWLYAHWDLTREQQLAYNALSLHHHLIVRVHSEPTSTTPLTEIHVHPESRHWFIEVEKANTRYVAEVGYYPREGQWESIGTSSPAITPPDSMSKEKTACFATAGEPGRLIPSAKELPTTAQPYVSYSKQELLSQKPQPNVPPRFEWIPALENKATGSEPFGPVQEHAALESIEAHALPEWSSSQEQALAELIGMPFMQPGAPSSLALALPPPMEQSGISSPLGAAPPPTKGFWFNFNAELVIYGATEPNAQVTIGGQPIDLLPDGTFSCRLTLPDGQHELQLTATSSENELRQAQLTFTRQTDYSPPSAK